MTGLSDALAKELAPKPKRGFTRALKVLQNVAQVIRKHLEGKGECYVDYWSFRGYHSITLSRKTWEHKHVLIRAELDPDKGFPVKLTDLYGEDQGTWSRVCVNKAELEEQMHRMLTEVGYISNLIHSYKTL